MVVSVASEAETNLWLFTLLDGLYVYALRLQRRENIHLSGL